MIRSAAGRVLRSRTVVDLRDRASAVLPGAARRLYGSTYFDTGHERIPGVTGYGEYERSGSNADVMAYLLWRFVEFDTSLDVGCARGFVVEALHELGYDAYGTDVSEFAISTAPASIADRLTAVDLSSKRERQALASRRFSLVTLLEVLEHIEPAKIPGVLRFIRSISDGFVVATIPSLGTNRNGPDGFPDGKVREDRLAHYKALNDRSPGPVPRRDLIRSATDNRPLEGHICIASFDWWTAQFGAAGFRRVDSIEQAMHPVIGRFELSVAWNLYVFHVDSSPAPPSPSRSEDELAELENRWGLVDRPVGVHSQNITRDTVGQEAVDAILAEYEASQRRHRT